MNPAAAKLIDRRLHTVPGKLRVAELFFDVPLNYSKPSEGTIRLFARSVRRPSTFPDTEQNEKPLPWLVYLQGGPGFGCRPPQEVGFVPFILDKGYQILLLDQRGTGLSSTITSQTLARQGNAVKQAEYLKNFRADNIVRDCEAIRKCLTATYPEEYQKWSVLGQSFGGFCATTYLSNFPEGLREVFLTGGLPPLVNGPDEVYKKTYEKVVERNQAYYQKYPEDAERVKRIVQYLQENKPRLGAGVLTPERFQQIGITFGVHGGLDSIHDVVLRMTLDLDSFGFLTRPILSLVESYGEYDNAVIYAILHEPIYCQGEASRWSADRLRAQNSRFRVQGNTETEIYFTGEMIYKDMFESYDELCDLKEVADILASTDDWPAIYDEAQLAKNEVPVYAATFVDDMYVAYEFATETAKKIKGAKQVITNTMYHSALRDRGDEVMHQLFFLKEDTID
ncbi:proline iminopeptidase [Talaromyces stipitatus ATCC 10500]|uniref:Proline iminopeptidase n=1 Tax=Talaromyces stipitatus (strain ATCC 10500 / CBS 375.48 / QM 6759 / NRRL 1006) TaxID=441959 RepID=B8LYU3_TALSN|nr:proline iminopeptidase [Talaromyces stipitatus ATCC 10500]EED23451.1 proline iminopeptidase [Talaromyces stipitatus ATCC 10500]